MDRSGLGLLSAMRRSAVARQRRASRILGLWTEEAGGGVRDRLERDRRGVEVATGDDDREVVVSADGDPTTWGGQRLEGFGGAVDGDQLFGVGAAKGGGAAIAADGRRSEE